MTGHELILELAQVIRPGDALTLAGGSVETAAGEPTNPSDHLQRQRGGIKSPYRYALWMMGWLVAVRTDWGWMPVGLHTIVQVERAGKVIWDEKGGRSGQRSLF